MTAAAGRLRLRRISSTASELIGGLDRWHVLSLVIAVSGLATVLVLTVDGPGVGGDSVHYVMGAENLAMGAGFSRISGGGEIKPITHFPPLFSIVLSPFALLGTELFSAARHLNAILYAVTIVLSVFMVRLATRSGAAALIAALLLLVSETLLTAYSYVMTEALYVVLSLAAILLLSYYLEGRAKLWSLVLSAILVAASVLTRYAGLSLAAACLAGVFLVGGRGWRTRLVDSALFGVLALAPLGLWFLRNRLVAETLANRAVSFHPMSTELINTYLGELVALVFARQVPLSWRPRALLAGAIAWSGPTFFAARSLLRKVMARSSSDTQMPHQAMRWLLLIYTVAYFGAFVTNTLFFDAGTTLSVVDRYLAPGYVVLVILSVITTYDLLRDVPFKRFAVPAGAVLAAFLIAIHVAQAAQLFGDPGIDLGYMRVRNENPDAVDTLRELDPNVDVVSNNPELFYMLSGRPAYVAPILQDPSSLVIRDDFPDQVRLVQRVLADGGALVLLFPIREEDRLVLDHVEVEQTRSLLVGSIYMSVSEDTN